MSNLDHIVLFLLLFLLFFLITRLDEKFVKQHFWKVVTLPILLFSFVIGGRYGWGNDYLWYKTRIEDPFFYIEEDIGFRWINITLKDWGFNYVGVYIIYALIFIICTYIFIRYYKGYNKYMLALFLPATLTFATFTIRQGLAHSFIFVAFYFLMKRKWIGVISMIIIGYLIHSSVLITVLICGGIYLFIYKISNKLPSLILLIGTYIGVTLGSELLSSHLTPLLEKTLSSLSLGGSKFQSYLDNSERWFGEEARNSRYEQGVLAMILSMLFHISIIYLGYIALKYKPSRNVLYVYYSTYFGLVLERLFFTFEIIKRIAVPFTVLYFIPLGYALSVYFKHKKLLTKKEKTLSSLAIICVVVYLILYYGRFIFQSPGCVFFWNNY